MQFNCISFPKSFHFCLPSISLLEIIQFLFTDFSVNGTFFIARCPVFVNALE